MLEGIVRKFLYFPERIPANEPPPSYCGDAEELSLDTEAGDRIHGLYWEPPRGRPVILFFHGNAQCVYEWALVREDFEATETGMLLIDYPGYGKSTGTPSEPGLYAAGKAAFSWLTDRVGRERIFVLGKSLGGGVATEVCLGSEPAGLVLESTFRSIPSVAATLFPVLPAGVLLHSERYESIKKISDIHCPVFVIHGSADQLIPVSEGRALYEAANDPKNLWIVEGAGHNNVALRAGGEYGRRLRHWIDDPVGQDTKQGSNEHP